MTRRWYALCCLVTLMTAAAGAQQNRIDIVTPLAPELAAYGPLGIGVQTVRAVDRDRPDILPMTAGGSMVRADRSFMLEVWYPCLLYTSDAADE